MDDLLAWANHEYKKDRDKKIIIADLELVHTLQIQYQKESNPSKKMGIAVKMQILMFSLQKKYLQKGYFVISDRGILSACLGGRDRAQNLSQFKQLVSMFDYLPIGSTIFVDLPTDVAMRRTKKKGENPDRKDLEAKSMSYVVTQDNLGRVLERFPNLSINQFYMIDGTKSQRQMLSVAESLIK